MHKILTLNNISPVGLEKLPKTLYNFGPEIEDPEAIILRSFKMHDMEIPESLLAVGRAGAGVNNIPVDKLTEMGIPVFNAPGANANAVVELIFTMLGISLRNVQQSLPLYVCVRPKMFNKIFLFFHRFLTFWKFLNVCHFI